MGLAPDTAALRVGAGRRQAARAEAEAWLAAYSRPDDVLFGYEPLYLGAWEIGAAARFPTTVVPRADDRLALRVLEGAVPLGRAVWVLDASERNNIRRSLEIEQRLPDPAAAVRGACLRAVPRSAHARARRDGRDVPLSLGARAPRRTLARDRRQRHQPANGRARRARGARLRPVPALPLEQLAVARRALEGGEARLDGPLPPAPRTSKPRGDRGGSDDAAEDERPRAIAATTSSCGSPSAGHETIVGR